MYKKIGIISILLSSILFSSCVTLNRAIPLSVKSFSMPEENEEMTVSIGDEMLSQGTSVTSKAIRVKKDSPDHKISKGVYKLDAFYKESETYIPVPETGASFKGMYQDWMGADFLLYQPKYVSANGEWFKNGYKLTTGFINGYRCFMTSSKEVPPEDYEITTVTINSEDNFKRTLLYTGRENNIVKFTYREFSDNFIRPDFSLDVQYDLNQSDIIAFKTAKLKILSATNSSIKYIVLSNFK